MAGCRKWSVESKEFEMQIKVGAAGVRIFERSKGKQRSIFFVEGRVRLAGGYCEGGGVGGNLEGILGSIKAGYSWFIAQKCANRYGRFLTFEEFNGRRRCGNILVPEGRRGQGWDRIISELCMGNKALNEAREVKEIKKGVAVRGRRSYVEAMGLSTNAEECFNSFNEPIAVVPEWLKAASTELGLQAQREGSREKVPEMPLVQSKLAGEQDQDSAKRRNLPPVKTIEGTKSTVFAGYGSLRGLQGESVLAGQSFNALQELSLCRVLLEKLKEEVDIGLARLDRVISKLEVIGPGQVEKESRAKHVASPKEKGEWVRPNSKKTFKPKNGVGWGIGSLGVKPSFGLRWVEATTQAGPSVSLPVMVLEDAGDQDPAFSVPVRESDKDGGFAGDVG
jgi:hypothetical protein